MTPSQPLVDGIVFMQGWPGLAKFPTPVPSCRGLQGLIGGQISEFPKQWARLVWVSCPRIGDGAVMESRIFCSCCHCRTGTELVTALLQTKALNPCHRLYQTLDFSAQCSGFPGLLPRQNKQITHRCFATLFCSAYSKHWLPAGRFWGQESQWRSGIFSACMVWSGWVEESVQNTGKNSICVDCLSRWVKICSSQLPLPVILNLVCTYGIREGGHFFPDQYVSAAEKIISGFWDHNCRLTIC